jgi:hypothetical protein
MRGNAMPQYKNACRYSLFTFFAGLFSIVFILFLQPMDPARFLVAAFNFSQLAAASVANPISTFVLWTAMGMLVFGFSGTLLFAFLKSRSEKAKPDEKLVQYSSTDAGEENWIFI